ncbi:MAG: GldG family protein [Betaproteobacteria bacterium]|nr:GldG family protein [Betaproteobacteria bacterium]
MQKRYQSYLYSSAGVIAVFFILVLANFVLGALSTRIDLTQGKLYTLSEGTRGVLAKLESPVKIRLYFTQGAEIPLGLKAFGRRVEDLLAEFRRAGNGKLLIEKLDPQPDSDAEDSAALDGVDAQVLPTGDRFYLGLAIGILDKRVAMPALSPEREALLEYDLARAIARATAKDKAVVGVMTPLPAFGMRAAPMMGMAQQDPWVFISELRRDFTVKRVANDVARIDDDIKVLLVMHPRGISDQTQYALDQFVMRGGKLIAFVDPYAYFDQLPSPMMQEAGGGTSSTLEKLFKAWSIGFDATKVVLDRQYASGAGQRMMPTVLTLGGAALDAEDVATSRIGVTLIPFAGAFTGKPAEGLSQSVLMKSSAFAALVDSSAATAQGDAALKDFSPTGTEYPLAIRLAGKFKTAFPEGRPPAPPKKDEKADKKAAKASSAKPAETPDAKGAPHLAASKEDNAVVLIADSDFLHDEAAVSIQDLFGQRIVIPSNGNIAFAQALVDQFAGDPALIRLRTRATAARPFTVIREMEARAQQAYLGKINALEGHLSQTQEKLQALQKAKSPGAGTILSAAQQAELDNFRRTAAETRRELKEVRKALRAESEALQFWTKVVNIAAIPLLVALAGLALALYRRRRVVAL